jgi:hypothetical protein
MSLGSFITNRSEIGQPYNLGSVTGADSRFDDDLAAIDTYVREETRPKVAQFPNSESLIVDYEKWRQDLGWYDKMVVPNDTMNSAKAKRNAINAAQQNVLPADSVVEEGSFLASPTDTSKAVISPITKFSLTVGAALAGVLLLAVGVSKVSPIALGKRMLAAAPKKKVMS